MKGKWELEFKGNKGWKYEVVECMQVAILLAMGVVLASYDL